MAAWARAAAGWHEAHGLRVARFGDNMRQVAVTEGDKVAAEIALGVAVNGFGISDLAAAVDGVSERAVEALLDAYDAEYAVAPELTAQRLPAVASCGPRRASRLACAT